MNSIMLAVIALVGGTVHLDGSTTLKVGTVLIRDGVVESVGTDIQVPAGATVVDATGKRITAGLFDPFTGLGLVEISGIASTNDGDSGRTDSIRAAYSVLDAYNPWSSLIPVQRVHGLTTVGLIPSGGVVSGQASVVDLVPGAIASQSAGIVASVGGRSGGSRAQTFALLREAVSDTRFFLKHAKDHDKNRVRSLVASRLDLEALGAVVTGQRPILLKVNRRSDILRALSFAKEMGVKLVLIGASEAWLVADELARQKVGVILNPVANAPGSFDAIHARSDAAALLRRAGVDVAFSTFSSHQARKLRQWAGNAVRAGLNWSDALDEVTSAPARLLGLKDRGSIRPGYVANLVVWSGDPFEFESRAETIIIQGRPIESRHRQQALFERYRSFDDSND